MRLGIRSATVGQPIMPGPPPMPVLGWRGNLLSLQRDPIAYVSAMYQAYGEIAALTNDHPSLIFAFGSHWNERLLSAPERFASTLTPAQMLDRAEAARIADALPTLIDDAFAAAYRATVIEQTTTILERWGLGQQVDVAYVMRRLTLRIAVRMLFGLDVPANVAAIVQVVERAWSVGWSSFISGAAFDLPGAPLHRLRRLIHDLIPVIAARLAERRADDEGLPLLPESLLARALAARNSTPFDAAEADIIAGVAALFARGYEATASAITWTLFLLSQHVNSLRDVRAEIVQFARGPVLATQLDHMPLLHRIVKESLRLFPPCSLDVRVCTDSCALGPYELAPGALVLYSPYITHRMADLYFAPRKFRPERWLYLDASPYAFLPFGDARTSVGVDLAIDEMKLVLATLFQRTLLALAPGATLDRSLRLAIMPRRGLPMIISPPNRGIVRREARGNVRDMIDL